MILAAMFSGQKILLVGMPLAVALWAAVLDWRHGRIPNWLTLPALAAGLLISTASYGWPGLKSALAGSGLALALLLPFVILRGLGAGDWKLMGALGSFLGPWPTAKLLFITVMIAGVMAVGQMIARRRVKETLRNLWVLLRAFSTFGAHSARDISLDNPGLMRLPFGVAAALAMLLFVVAQSAYKTFLS
ncbi:MAG: prepilin peptidase [Acidobacteria bacterium]|nr:prepilin peptidase [Acidobacteriota bacterium]